METGVSKLDSLERTDGLDQLTEVHRTKKANIQKGSESALMPCFEQVP